MFLRKQQIAVVVSLIIITPLGFLTKAYHGPAAHWVNDSLCGLFYVIFWCLVVFFFLPRTPPIKIALLVFFATDFIEILQLWHLPLLEYLRSYFLGRVVLGTTFAWSDFLYYALGAVLGLFWMRKMASLFSVS